MKPVVIIGTGLAGYSLARELRKLDANMPLQIVTADDGQFYSKPMLSNALTKNMTPSDLAIASAEQMAQELNATIRINTRVTAIDTVSHRLGIGEDLISYDKLVLALGAKPDPPPLKGDAASEALSINNLDDYAHFRNAIDNCTRIAIIGPGLIGCEFANDLSNAGKQVTVIGPDPIPLARLLPTEAGNALRDALKRIGIEWRLGVFVEEMGFNGNGYRLQLSDATYVDAEIVLSAVGLRPNIRLARTTGLRTNRGIVVDRNLATSTENVYALGDCMEVAGLVLPFVMPITHCARTLARTLVQQPTQLFYPAMPVAVKTSAHPVIVAPPPPGANGDWRISIDGGGVRAEFRDDNRHRQLLGFALTGTATRDRQSLTSGLPPLLA